MIFIADKKLANVIWYEVLNWNSFLPIYPYEQFSNVSILNVLRKYKFKL